MRTLPLCLSALALAMAGCSQSDTGNNAEPAQSGEARKAAGEKTIAASLNQDGSFVKAAKSVGLDATLAGPGPYTVLVPSDEAFGKVPGGVLDDTANPPNRGEATRLLTYHILPGVILAEDIGKAIDNGNGKAVLATMGGETLTATREGDAIVLADGAGGKAKVTKADEQYSNGVVHHIDTVLVPPKGNAGGNAPAGGTAPQQ